jgi:NADH-quinone oxidoreductase subunit N
MDLNSLIYMKSELCLLLIFFILLFMKISGSDESRNPGTLRLINTLLFLNFVFGFFFNDYGSLFNDMFHTNKLIAFEKNILNLGMLLISLQSFDWLKKHKFVAEYYMLLLSTLLGMFFMISSGNLMMFYMGLELSTIPLAAVITFDHEKSRSSEAGMKMILSSAFASGMMLFGISLLYGSTGTLNLNEMSKLLSGSELQLLGIIFIMAGFGFKISAVPFHLWTADVYEGAPVNVTSFLSVISKGAVFFIFISFIQTIFVHFPGSWLYMMYIMIAITITIANLFAIRQENLKRFLAFSSIVQAGYILLGLSANTASGNSSAVFFLLAYIFTNLGAFGVISIISTQTGKENINDLKGFYKTNPRLSWALALSMFSLAGIPPTAGFFGKLFLLTSGAAGGNYILLSIAALNMVISLYYYIRVVKAMFVDQNDSPIESIQSSAPSRLAIMICSLGILLTGFAGGLFDYIFALFP